MEFKAEVHITLTKTDHIKKFRLLKFSKKKSTSKNLSLHGSMHHVEIQQKSPVIEKQRETVSLVVMT